MVTLANDFVGASWWFKFLLVKVKFNAITVRLLFKDDNTNLKRELQCFLSRECQIE